MAQNTSGEPARSSPFVHRDPTLSIPAPAPIPTKYALPIIHDDGSKPSLAIEQLIIMALITAPDRELSMAQICAWISNNIRYYRDQVIGPAITEPGSACAWVLEVETILHQYEFPTIPIHSQGDDRITFHLAKGREWFILPNPEIDAKKHIRLLDLPMELRLMIYRKVMFYPLPKQRGWIIDADYTANRKYLYQHNTPTPQSLTTKGPGGFTLLTPSLDKVLALLQVNQQVHEEAAPVFCRSNYFYFDSATTLYGFLTGMPSRFKFVRNIILNYDPLQINHKCNRTFKLLAATKIRNLHLVVRENELMDKLIGCASICQLPGLKKLGELRGLDLVTFEGDFHKISSYLAEKGIRNTKPGDECDDDEMAADKLEADQKTYFKAILRARKELVKCRKREAKAADLAKIKEERAKHKRRELEARAAKTALKIASKEQNESKRLLKSQIQVQNPQDKEATRKHNATKAKAKKAQYAREMKTQRDAVTAAAARLSKIEDTYNALKRKQPNAGDRAPSSGKGPYARGATRLPPREKVATVPSMAAQTKVASKRKVLVDPRARMVDGQAVPIEISSDSSSTTNVSETDLDSDFEHRRSKAARTASYTKDEKARELAVKDATQA
jgi:hypothetical protein